MGRQRTAILAAAGLAFGVLTLRALRNRRSSGDSTDEPRAEPTGESGVPEHAPTPGDARREGEATADHAREAAVHALLAAEKALESLRESVAEETDGESERRPRLRPHEPERKPRFRRNQQAE